MASQSTVVDSRNKRSEQTNDYSSKLWKDSSKTISNKPFCVLFVHLWYKRD